MRNGITTKCDEYQRFRAMTHQENIDQGDADLLDYGGSTIDLDKWVKLTSRCHYLPEPEMITLCNM